MESDDYISEYGEVSAGTVTVTGPGYLPCKHIIHAVGPIWSGGHQGEAELLKSAIQWSIVKAEELMCRNLALPAISSGIYGYPVNQCADIFMNTINNYFNKGKDDTWLQLVSLTIIDDPTLKKFIEAYDRKFE